MAYKTLITRNGTAPYDGSQFTFDVIYMERSRSPEAGSVDLIGPGFWVAVVEEGSNTERLSLGFPGQPGSPESSFGGGSRERDRDSSHS